MIRKLLKLALWVMIVGAALKAVAAGLTRLIGQDDDPDSPQFRLTTIMDGTEFTSTATGLRSGQTFTVMGGVALDLREASLDSGGAELKLTTYLGGVRVLVSDKWRVNVEEDARSAQHQIELPDDPPTDGPQLDIKLGTRFGGVVVATAPSDHHIVRD